MIWPLYIEDAAVDIHAAASAIADVAVARNLAVTCAIRQGQRAAVWNLKHGTVIVTYVLNLLAVQANGDIALDFNGFIALNITTITTICRS